MKSGFNNILIMNELWQSLYLFSSWHRVIGSRPKRLITPSISNPYLSKMTYAHLKPSLPFYVMQHFMDT